MNAATASKNLKIAFFSVLGISVVLYTTFLIAMGIYAYGNPDPRHCYYIYGLDTPALSTQAAKILAQDRGILVKDGYPIDVAHLFRSWFLWGFWGSIFQVIIFAVFIPLAFVIKQPNVFLYNVLFASFECISVCNGLVWFVLGFFWRYSRGGRVASGEKLERLAGLSNEDWKYQLDAARVTDGY